MSGSTTTVIDQYHYDSNNGEVIRYYGLYSEIEIDEKDFGPYQGTNMGRILKKKWK